MRHGKKFNHLGRKSAHRKALLKNLAISLIEHKRIVTTLAKAKELRKYVEPIATKSKSDTTHSRRTVFSYLHNKEAVKELFGTVAPKIMERPGGYTRILKLGPRYGDGAEMAMIEFVDFNEFGYTQEKEAGSRRRRRKPAAKPAATSKPAAETASVAAAPAAEVVEDVPPVAEATDAATDAEATEDNKEA